MFVKTNIKSQKTEAPLRVPPHNLDAEQAVLGGILLDNGAINRAVEILSPDGIDFYSPAHARLFKAMVSLDQKGSPVDLITMSDMFKEGSELDAVGGVSYIGVLVESTPSAANINYYANIVKEKSLLRKLISASIDIAGRAYEGGLDIEETIDHAERIIFEATQERIKKSHYAMKELVKDAFETIEKLYSRKAHITGVPTGFQELDVLTSGLQPSDLIIIAGRPGMGKTSFALNIAEHAAIEALTPVAVFSLEMSKEQLAQRMLATRARVGLHRIRKGKLSDEDWPRLTTAAGTLCEAPIYIDDTPAINIYEIRTKARRWKSELNLGLLIIDYLQLMRSVKTASNREQEIAEISRSLKALAKELAIPVVALSQLARRAEQREKSKPQLADLRESGAIEQDADIVMFVYREGYYKKCECPKDDRCSCGWRDNNTAEIFVEKHRNGPTGDIKLTFLRELTRFEDQSPRTDDDIRGGWVE